jgi:hypothetical protein
MVAHGEYAPAPVHERVDLGGLVEVAVLVGDQVWRAREDAEQPQLIEAV